MFGYVMANVPELSKEQKNRYMAVYCGICRQIRKDYGNVARLTLSYDMAFLALILMSLYEPAETGGKRACCLHPVKPRPWVDSEFIRYGADMNVLLAYFNARDDYQDEGHAASKIAADALKKHIRRLEKAYPRQYRAIEEAMEKLHALEKENCPNPDLPASTFGQLMGELFVVKEDRWGGDLRTVGHHLGRYIYLADAAVDYRRDKRKKQYNPFLAMGMEENPRQWEQYLVLEMGRCMQSYEHLPLVQDKAILDNILYSGIWVEYRRRQRCKITEE